MAGVCDWVFGGDWLGEDGKAEDGKGGVGVGVGIVLFALGSVFGIVRYVLTRFEQMESRVSWRKSGRNE